MDALNSFATANGYSGSEATALKSSSIWNGDDAFGFNAIPAGQRKTGGSFVNIDSDSFLWSSSVSGSMILAHVMDNGATIVPSTYDRDDGLSVRCLKD